uniref:DDE-1 domain-containing protein n=1 Tax=Strongyloides venezuelensis TaxID=75913 RepID=A0A0K0G4H6_STRVS
MLNTNMTGSDKKNLLIIGHFAKPRCFNNVTKLNVHYEHNGRAWMNSQIYNNYLKNWNKKLISQGKEVLLFQDQCSFHKLFKNYSNITVVNFKKNTTSFYQPLDAGIIKWVKQHYKKTLVADIIKRFNAAENVNNENFKWEKKLPPEIIKKCFVKYGFQPSGESVIISNNDDKDTEINILLNQVQLFAPIVNIGDIKSSFELLNLDNNIPTSSTIDDLETNNLTGCNVSLNICLEDESIDDDSEIIPSSIEEVKKKF